MKQLDNTQVRKLSLDDLRSVPESELRLHEALQPQVSRYTTTHSDTVSPVAALDDILGLLFKPAASQDQDTTAVFKVLFRALVAALRLDYLHLRALDESGQARIDVVERIEVGGNSRDAAIPASAALDEPVSESGAGAATHGPFRFEFSAGRLSGVLIAEASRAGFPSPAEQLVLNIAARKIVRDLGELPYDKKQILTPAIEQLAVRMGARLELAEDAVPRRQSVPLDAVRESYKNKLVTGMPDWRLRELFDLVPTMAWSSFPDGSCEFLNRKHYEYTGLSAAQSREWGWQAAIHPQDISRRMEKWRESLASGRPSEVEVRIRRRDGMYRWFLLRIEPFHDQFGSIVRWYGAGTDIEDRKRAEEKWSASEKRLSLLINTVPMLIWSCLPDGHADFFNEQWYNYTAFSPSQSDGWGWTAALHPDDYRHATQHWRMVTTTEDQHDSGFEARIKRKDGEYRWFWLRANAMWDEVGIVKRWYVTSIDIHDRKLAEEEVRRSEAVLAEAQRLTGLGTFSWRVGATHVSLCGTLCNIFGFECGAAVTRSMIEERTHPGDSPFIFERVKQGVEKGENFEEQMRVLMPDGSVKYLHYCAYATKAPSGEVEYIGTAQDVTERYLASEALEQARAELAKAARASSLGVLTAAIAHEVNQPLAGIVMNANTSLRMLSSDPPNIAGAVETARRTIRDGKRAADVISRLRKLFKHKEINASWWGLGDATREVIELVQDELRRDRIALTELFDDGVPPVKGDRIQIQQVILNLVRNAIDAIDAAQGKARTIVVSISYKDNFVCLSVEDSGTGFDAAAADKLFEEFYTTKQDGMGIGLSVSRWIVEAHGGKVWAERKQEKGAIVGFSIPCQSNPNTESVRGAVRAGKADLTL
ncbi:PAS domain S-box-containing protein [Paraburkholderia sp. GAS199]|uniref:PAS domain-containing protein n=1 Tax=Paraburkholderia sp. GAS199 TaxID=3035126 RepID=UPI003D24ABC5